MTVLSENNYKREMMMGIPFVAKLAPMLKAKNDAKPVLSAVFCRFKK